MRVLPLKTWKMAAVFAVVGGLLGAAYAHHRAARVRVVVTLRPIDQMPISGTVDTACAELMDAEKSTREQLDSRGMATDTETFTLRNCYKSKGLVTLHREGNNLFVEYERGDEKGFARAKAFTDSPHDIALLPKDLAGLSKPSVVEPILVGVATALLLAVFLQIVRLHFRPPSQTLSNF
jgi:hypothetical protein